MPKKTRNAGKQRTAPAKANPEDRQPNVLRGLILMDAASGQTVGVDRGATAILDDYRTRSRSRKDVSAFDKDILALRQLQAPRPETVRRAGGWNFTCRSYFLEGRRGSGLQSVIAIIVEKRRA